MAERRFVAADLLVVVGIAALLLFARFRCALQEPQEARYAEIPRQMLAGDHFLVPVLHGQPYCDKPPLFYWLVMASYSVFGVHDWAARLVCCTIAFLCVLLTWVWGCWLAGPRAGLLGALILCLSPRFVQLERMVTMDGLLCLSVVAAWATAQRALAGGFRPGWWLVSAVACGVGLLTKGPVALVLVLVPVLAQRWLDPSAERVTLRRLAGWLIVCTGMAAPWYVAVALCEPTFVEYFFWTHHVQRFVDPLDHEEPIWYYLPVLLGGMLPWTLLLPAAVWQADQRPAPRVFLAASLWCLVFFSLAGCKRAFYILPAMPPLALALGCYLDARLPVSVPGWKALFQFRCVWAWMATLLLLLIGLGASVAAHLTGVIGPATGMILEALAGGGGVLVLVLGVRQCGSCSWGVCGLVALLVMVVGVYEFMPGYARRFALRGLVRRHAPVYGDRSVPVYCYPRRWDSISFYLQRSNVEVFGPEEMPELIAEMEKQPEALVFVKTGTAQASWASALRSNLPAALQFEMLGRQGHLTVGRVVRRP